MITIPQTKLNTFINDLNSNLGNEAPQIKYTKNFGTSASSFEWQVYANAAGKPIIVLKPDAGSSFELQPDIDASYK